MLYNIELQKENRNGYCMTCKYFNRRMKRCEGIGKNCFEYDPKTMTAIDPITKLPIRLDKIKK